MAKLWSSSHACPADAYFDLPCFTRDTPLIFNWVDVVSKNYKNFLLNSLSEWSRVPLRTHTVNGTTLQPRTWRVTRGSFIVHKHSFAPPRCPSGTILLALCLMVWDFRVLRAEPTHSHWPNPLNLFISYCFLYFFLPCVGCVGLGSSD